MLSLRSGCKDFTRASVWKSKVFHCREVGSPEKRFRARVEEFPFSSFSPGLGEGSTWQVIKSILVMFR